MDFIALDLETANADMSSICQIGLADFKNGLLQEEWKTYIDPEDFFDGMNVSIHGIDESTVKASPILPEVSNRLYNYLDGRIVVCHTHFDRVALQQACSKYNLRTPSCIWLDTARVTRRTWDQFAWSGYGLLNVCDSLGYKFAHHDALEDAKAAAHILLAAIEKTGIDLQSWLKRIEEPINLIDPIAREGNEEGSLFGEVLVFTGALTLPRREAAALAAKIGCTVANGVTKDTTILVVGDQDVKKLSGHDKSSKHRKAESLIKKGQSLRIIRESDFKELVNLSLKQKDDGDAFDEYAVTVMKKNGKKSYKLKEAAARELREKAKTLEKSDPKESIRLYRISLATMLEVDTLIREKQSFKKQITELGYDPGTWRRASLPIERITALLEKEKNYSECLSEINNYDKIKDRKGLSQNDLRKIRERKRRITGILEPNKNINRSFIAKQIETMQTAPEKYHEKIFTDLSHNYSAGLVHPYTAEIKHLGLGVSCKIQDYDKDKLIKKVNDQFINWNDEWLKYLHQDFGEG
jgi:DNA polymerase-3 subunit epsilon